jgi:DNA-binding protein YbaB
MSMPSFGQMKDLYKIQRDAKRVKKELKNIHVEAEADGVKVVVSADQEIVEMTIADDVPRDQIGPRAIDALNRANKKAQLVAAERMQGIMQQMGLPAGGLTEE